MSGLTCPKCQSEMRSYERNGVTVDQCTGCRGVFLDRGELERLVDAEGSFYEQRGFDAPTTREPERRDYESRDHERRDYEGRDHERRDYERREHGGGYGQHGYGKKRKKKESFLGDLLDF